MHPNTRQALKRRLHNRLEHVVYPRGGINRYHSLKLKRQLTYHTHKLQILHRFVQAKRKLGGGQKFVLFPQEHQITSALYICAEDGCLCEELFSFAFVDRLAVSLKDAAQKRILFRRLLLQQVVQPVLFPELADETLGVVVFAFHIVCVLNLLLILLELVYGVGKLRHILLPNYEARAYSVALKQCVPVKRDRTRFRLPKHRFWQFGYGN